MTERAAADVEAQLASASVSSLVVKLPAESAPRQEEVTLESLTRSYREGLLLSRHHSDEEEDPPQPAGSQPDAKQHRPKRQRKTRQPPKLLTEMAAPHSANALASASFRQSQGAPVHATLFDPALKVSGQLYKPPGYFLVTPRLGERANLERRRWALRNSRRGQLLQVLGEPYWPAHSARSRPATARQADSSRSLAIHRELSQQQQQQQQQSEVSLASLIKRFPEDFIRLPTPDFRSSGPLSGSRLGMSGRPPSARHQRVASATAETGRSCQFSRQRSHQQALQSPSSCCFYVDPPDPDCGVGELLSSSFQRKSQAKLTSSSININGLESVPSTQPHQQQHRQRPLTSRQQSASAHHRDACFRTAPSRGGGLGEFFVHPEWSSEVVDRLRVDGSAMLVQQQQQQQQQTHRRCRSAPPKRDAAPESQQQQQQQQTRLVQVRVTPDLSTNGKPATRPSTGRNPITWQ